MEQSDTMVSLARQRWSARAYEQHARFVSDLGTTIVEWLAPRPGERILDLGCGDGALTAGLAASGVRVTGVDTSDELLAAARARGLDVRRMDGQSLDFNGEFDAVFSNAALHWMHDARAVLAGVRRALKPGGRFVAELGGHGNVAALATAMRYAALRHGGDPALAMPWYFPTADEYAALLESERFTVDRIVLAPRPTPLPTGLRGWLATFNEPFFAQFEHIRDRVLDELESVLAPSLRNKEGVWTADYVRLRVQARRAD